MSTINIRSIEKQNFSRKFTLNFHPPTWSDRVLGSRLPWQPNTLSCSYPPIHSPTHTPTSTHDKNHHSFVNPNVRTLCVYYILLYHGQILYAMSPSLFLAHDEYINNTHPFNWEIIKYEKEYINTYQLFLERRYDFETLNS